MSERLEERIRRRASGDGADRLLWSSGAAPSEGRWMTGREYLLLADRCSETLHTSGFREGDRIVAFLPNCPMVHILSLAVWTLGGTFAPINPRGGEEWTERILAHLDPALVVVGPGFDSIAQIAARCGIPSVQVSPAGPMPETKLRTMEFPGSADTAVIFATSGTTGLPKAVPLTHANLIDNTAAVNATVEGFEKGRTLMNVLPNFHSFGFTVCGLLPLVCGLSEALSPSFMPLPAFFGSLRAAQPDVLIAVPTMLPFILGAVSKGEKLPDTLRYILTGGGKLDPALEARFRKELGVITFEGYGLTECSPVVAANPSDARRRTGTVGLPMPGYDVQVRNEAGTPLPAGEEGVLWVRGPSVSAGYFRDPEQTAERFRDGWFNTGDMVRIDADGYIAILDRVSDMLVVSGFNVYPQEVETVIREIPGVRETAVVGVSNPVTGEVPVAFVIADESAGLTQSDVIGRCKAKLAHYKVPRKVRFVTELPMSSVGKVLKRKLREMMVKETKTP
jgi:long-chain acyl-CoA synthetase